MSSFCSATEALMLLSAAWSWAVVMGLAFAAAAVRAASAAFEAGTLAAPVLLLERDVGVGTSGTIDGTAAVAGVCTSVDCEPDWMMARPPGRIEPENAA